MSEIKWIKITTSIFDDEAIKIIEQMPEGDALLVIWLKLLIQAGIINDSGLIYFKKDIPYTEDMLAIIFHKPVTLIRLALTTFVKFGMIEIADNQTILIRNWEKHQNADALELYNKGAKERMRRYRERQKQKLLFQNSDISQKNDDVTFPLRNTLRHVTGIEEEEDIDKELINNTHTINVEKKTKNVCVENQNLSEEDLKLLKKYAKENGAKNIKPYVAKLISNGAYIEILEEEKEKAAKRKAQQALINEQKEEEQETESEMTEEERQAFLQKMREKAGINNKRRSKR